MHSIPFLSIQYGHLPGSNVSVSAKQPHVAARQLAWDGCISSDEPFPGLKLPFLRPWATVLPSLESAQAEAIPFTDCSQSKQSPRLRKPRLYNDLYL